MKVKEIMSANPVCCTLETRLQEVARLMRDHDCGEIPVLADRSGRNVVGVVTDRDIACRTVASGKNPLTMAAKDCMSTPVVTVSPDMSIEECCRLMEDRQIRRVPVVDDAKNCRGIVSQADLARHAPPSTAAAVLSVVSRRSL
jgi:CBS-domain-containing membrane protein